MSEFAQEEKKDSDLWAKPATTSEWRPMELDGSAHGIAPGWTPAGGAAPAVDGVETPGMQWAEGILAPSGPVLNWSTLPPMPGPAVLEPVQLRVAQHVPSSGGILPEATRAQALHAVATDMGVVESSWNAVCPLINGFREAHKDLSLDQDVLPAPSKEPGGLDQVVESSTVATGNPTKLRDLFPSGEYQAIDAERQAAGFDQAGKQAEVGMGALDVAKEDAMMSAGMAGVERATHGLAKARASFEAATLDVQAGEAERQRQAAADDVQRVQSEKAAVLGIVSPILDVLGGAVGIGSAFRLPKGEPRLNPDTAAAGSTMAGAAAQMLLDQAFAGRIEAAEAKVEAASQRLEHLESASLATKLVAAVRGVKEALADLKQARYALRATARGRRAAYQQLGQQAASAAGGDPGARQRMQALVAAIPNVELVFGRAQAILSAIRLPTYTAESGHGTWLLQQAGDHTWDVFTDCLAMLKQQQAEFTSMTSLWSERLATLRLLIAKLGVPS